MRFTTMYTTIEATNGKASESSVAWSNEWPLEARPPGAPPSATITTPAHHMVITICEALKIARTHGFFCSSTFARSVLTPTIHTDAAGPQIISAAMLAVEAMLAVPAPDSVGIQSDSDTRQIRVHRT